MSTNQKTIVTVLQSKKIKFLQESEPVEQDSLFDQVSGSPVAIAVGRALRETPN